MAPPLSFLLAVYLGWIVRIAGAQEKHGTDSLLSKPVSLFRVGSGAVGSLVPRPAVPTKPNTLPRTLNLMSDDFVIRFIDFTPCSSYAWLFAT